MGPIQMLAIGLPVFARPEWQRLTSGRTGNTVWCDLDFIGGSEIGEGADQVE